MPSSLVVSYQAGITRNAPWATLSPVILNKSNPSSIHKTDGQSCDSGSSADSSGSLAAQVRITSVAARAIPHIISQKFSTSTSMPQPGALSPYRGPGREDREENSFALHSFAREEMGKGEGVSSQCGGYIRLLEYMEKCLPTQPEGGDAKHDHEHDWKALQAAPIPTLLPSLRFHDLVFGRELGKGSFGTVKYARMIVRGKPQSEWPEYAVKIVSGDTLLNKGYSWATAREMAVLQTIAHPGFARMISSFKYTHSAYMVLEYASGGDLHSQVVRSFQRRGPMSFPLSHLCTRFILGEVASALLSLHQMDLSFNDLKPENILITGKGHVKIADFGACRALTPSSWEKLETESKRLLSGDALRNGDWKDPGPDILEVCCVGYRDGNFGDTDVVTDIRCTSTLNLTHDVCEVVIHSLWLLRFLLISPFNKR